MAEFFQLRIELEDIEPMIWRRVAVPSSLTLFELHVVIQGAMGWNDSHLHMFDISGKRYEIPEDDELGPEPGCFDERLHKLTALLSEGMMFSYVYDFGDDWRHLIVVEKQDGAVPDWVEPNCIAGERACPPDNCGGRFGYSEFLDGLSNPEHPEHGERVSWSNNFEPEIFSVSQANSLIAALRQLFSERDKGI